MAHAHERETMKNKRNSSRCPAPLLGLLVPVLLAWPASGAAAGQRSTATTAPQQTSTTRAGASREDGASRRCRTDRKPQPNVGIEEPGGLGGCPPGMAPVFETRVCIDRWEAHLVEVTDRGLLRPWSPYFNPAGQRVRARSAPGAVPQGYISAVQAAAACREAGKRLCRAEEWDLACRGPDGTTFPYGERRQQGVCNDARAEHPAFELYGRRDRAVFRWLDNPCINQLADGLARTGEHPGCVTPGEVYDLMGNLHEWIDDPAGTFKGGYYVDTWRNGPGCLYRTTAHHARYWDYSTGFRCCADLPPAARPGPAEAKRP